jgi:hypothetical protein
MKQTTHFASLLAGSLLFDGHLLFAQEIQYRLVNPTQSSATSTTGAANTPGEYGSNVLFRAVEKEVSEGVFDPVAQPTLDSATSATKAVFNVPSVKLEKAATRQGETGDVLVAKWSVREPYGTGSVVLRDTPFLSVYAFRFVKLGLTSEKDLTAFLSAFLIWNSAGPTYLHSLTVPVDARSSLIQSFKADWPLTYSVDSGLREGIAGIAEGGDWFIALQLRKSRLGAFYGGRPYVPERFPPLSELAKSWSTPKIRGEIGKTVKPTSNDWYDFSDQRDRILIAELAKRGLSQDQTVELLRDVPQGSYDLRLSTVVNGFSDAGIHSFAKLYLSAALNVYKQVGPPARKAVEDLFIVAGGQCSADFETQATATLQEGAFWEGPLHYLGKCSTSQQTIEAIEKITMPTQELDRMKESTVDQIRRNIEHPVKAPTRKGSGQA